MVKNKSISFNKDFYSLESIKKSVKDYKEVATFTIEDKKDVIKVDIDCLDDDFKDLIDQEFCNYVLSIEKNKRA